jgi:membrane protease YdiL (CAAX protease family)
LTLDKRQWPNLVGNPRSDAERQANSWGPLATLGLGAVAALGSQVPALLAYFWWREVTLAHWAEIASDGVAVVMLVCLSTPVQVGLLIWFAKKAGSTAVSYLALTLPSYRKMGTIVVAAMVLVSAGDGMSAVFGGQVVTPFQSDIYRSAAKAGAVPLLWLTVVAMAPIGEEILFRGFLFRGWQRWRHGAGVAIGSTALVWAAVHIQYSSLVVGEIFVVGLVLGWIRWFTGSTVSTIILHAVLNSVGLIETSFSLNR